MTGTMVKKFEMVQEVRDPRTDDLLFYVLFNSISVISEQWEGDNEMLCTIKPVYD